MTLRLIDIAQDFPSNWWCYEYEPPKEPDSYWGSWELSTDKDEVKP